MKKIHIIGLALFAVFAFSAVAVASASAAEWLCKEGGVFKACATEKASDAAGTLLLSNKTLLGTIDVDCSGLAVGTVGPGAADLVTEVLNNAMNSTDILCEVLEGVSLCGSEALAEAINLPWVTKLLSTTVDDLTGSGNGNPGWFVECLNAGKAKDHCTKELAELTIENLATGVDETFKEAENATCENGTGKVAGTVLVTPTEAGVELFEVS